MAKYVLAECRPACGASGDLVGLQSGILTAKRVMQRFRGLALLCILSSSIALYAAQARDAFNFDHQFDSGSGIMVSQLTRMQIDNLVTLGKIWGFLKYHHPRVTSGQMNWDHELFRILPAVLQAQDQASANSAMLHWINDLGAITPCQPCAHLDVNDLDLRPDLDWIADEGRLGTDLSKKLHSIWANRVPGQQFYVEKPSNGPIFRHEEGYAGYKLPDSGLQLLAFYRFWNIVEYWSPNRNITDENWNRVLAKFIPKILRPTMQRAISGSCWH